MISLLKYTHLAFILVAILFFILSFYWQLTKHKNAQKVVFTKALLHTHLTILVLGVLLIWAEQINPFAGDGLWVVEKTGAFIAYMVMVSVALNKEKQRAMQILAFLGAFGWLAYIAHLAVTKEAILLVG